MSQVEESKAQEEAEFQPAEEQQQEEPQQEPQPEAEEEAAPWYRTPLVSLAIDQAVSSRMPQDTTALLFWHNPISSAAVLAALILGHAFLFFDFGISKISIVCAVAEYTLIISLVVGSVYKLVDKYMLKNDPPRNIIDMHVGVHVRQVRKTLEAVIPTRQELIDGFNNALDKGVEIVNEFGSLCLSTDISKVVPVVVGLHLARTAFCFVSLTRLYYLCVIFFFTVPYAYSKHKEQVDAAVCPKVEQARVAIVGLLDRVWEMLPEKMRNSISATSKPKAE